MYCDFLDPGCDKIKYLLDYDDFYVMVGTDGGGWLHGEQVQAG